MATNVRFNRVTHRRVALLFDPVVQSGIVFHGYLCYIFVKLLSVRFDVYKLASKCWLVKLLGVKESFFVLLSSLFQFSLVTCSVLLFINNYLSHGATLSKFMLDNTNLKGKVAIVTGGYSGIGYETVLQLLKWNCKVVICGRNKTKATNAIEKLKSTNSFDPSNLSFIEMDLDNLLSVKKAVELFEKTFDRLDFLINNAGFYNRRFNFTACNLESNFSSNFLGHFYLTQLLLNLVKKTSGRIINVSSIAHFKYDPNTDPIFENKSTSSLIPDFFNRLKIDAKNVVCVSLAPGVVITPLMMPLNRRIFFSVPRFMAPLIMKRPVDGAATTLYLCAVDRNQLIPGAYYDNKRLAFVSKFAHDYDREEKLYSLAEELIKEHTR